MSTAPTSDPRRAGHAARRAVGDGPPQAVGDGLPPGDAPGTAGAYDVVAPAYDLLTAGYAYEPWLRAIEHLAIEHGLSGRRALDVACGTGKSLEALLELGFEACGCDASPGMAAVARRKLGERADVFVADMRSLPVYGSFDLVTCLDDALNHLPTARDVSAALRAMGANLAPRGLLAFDVNTLRAYRETGDRIVEDAERIVLWHGGPARLDRPGGRAEVAMDVMSLAGDGLWRRASASWGHWHYPLASIPALVAQAGLEVVAVRGQHAGGRLERGPDEQRHRKALFLARRAGGSRDRAQCSCDGPHARDRAQCSCDGPYARDRAPLRFDGPHTRDRAPLRSDGPQARDRAPRLSDGPHTRDRGPRPSDGSDTKGGRMPWQP